MRLKIIAVLAAVFMVKAGLALASDFSLCRFPNLVLPSEVQVFAADLEGGAGLDWLVPGLALIPLLRRSTRG